MLPDHLLEQLLTICRTPQNRDMLVEAIETGGGDLTADEIAYDNAASGLAATDLQAAVDELASGSGGGGDVTTNTDQTITGIKNFQNGLVTVQVTSAGGTGSSQPITVKTGGSSAANSGYVQLSTGSAHTASGQLQLNTGDSDTTSGAVAIKPGYSSGSVGGEVTIISGDCDTGRTGNITIASADAFTADRTGDVIIKAGDNSDTPALVGKVIMQFIPTVPGNWSPVPDNVVDALNQLAARVKALEP